MVKDRLDENLSRVYRRREGNPTMVRLGPRETESNDLQRVIRGLIEGIRAMYALGQRSFK